MKVLKKDDLPVYEAEIIDEDEKSANPVSLEALSPQRKLAYRIGKAVGSIAVVVGFFTQMKGMIKPGSAGNAGMGRGMGKGKQRRKKRKMRRIT
jgi:hypothetical protein